MPVEPSGIAFCTACLTNSPDAARSVEISRGQPRSRRVLDELSVGRQPRVDARARHVALAELRACRGGQRQPVAGLPSHEYRHGTAASGQGGAGPQGAVPGDSRGTAAAAELVAGVRRTPAVRG